MTEERPDYDTLVQDINLNDITSSEKNADVLRMLRDGCGDPLSEGKKSLYITNYDDPEHINFVIDEGDDLGWLGYFVGKCEVLEELYFYHLPDWGDEINSFFDSMSQNRSIEYLHIFDYFHIGADGWSRLGNFLENNRNLARFEVEHFVVEQEGIQHLASAFGQMNHNSLKDLSMNSVDISDEGLTELVTGLRSQSQLECLYLDNNRIGRDGCVALGNMLSRWPHSNNLKKLDLGRNVIDDGGLQVLVEGLMNCCSLKALDLGGNRLITAAGLNSLFPLLQSKSHSLEILRLTWMAFGDEGAIALAEGLRGNTSLKQLSLSPETSGMTSVGWSAFSKLLCDTSTINNTYLSNHTLTMVGRYNN